MIYIYFKIQEEKLLRMLMGLYSIETNNEDGIESSTWTDFLTLSMGGIRGSGGIYWSRASCWIQDWERCH